LSINPGGGGAHSVLSHWDSTGSVPFRGDFALCPPNSPPYWLWERFSLTAYPAIQSHRPDISDIVFSDMGSSERIRVTIAMMRRRVLEIDGLIERIERERTKPHAIRTKASPESRQSFRKMRRSGH
jgi:hypothetical protein